MDTNKEEQKVINVYDTNDPKKLLALKRLEADALLDVLRTINHDELKIIQLCTICLLYTSPSPRDA